MSNDLQVFSKTIDLGDGKVITIETGKLAKQADGSVVVRLGDTMLLATAVSAKDARDDVDFLPLTVDYREKYAATGRFPGGFFKREARPSDGEVLTMRLVDRALRPMFPKDYHADTQVMVQLMSSDKENMPDALAGLAASAALAVSDIPFDGPISEVRVARIDGKFCINPTFEELKKADMDLMVAGTIDTIVMVEGEMDEVSEQDLVDGIAAGAAAITVHCQAQLDLAAMVEKSKVKREYNHEDSDEELYKAMKAACYQPCYDVAKKGSAKEERSAAFKEIKNNFFDTITEEQQAKKYLFNQYFSKVQKSGVRDCMLEERIRLDGRKSKDIRDIWCEVDYLPSAHGSAIFTRGETQSLTTLTLGSKMDEQLIDGALRQGTEKFLLHYNFPPFCTGESRPLRGTSRREVGHGNLALRALKKVLPSLEDNPYTMRIVSEILESNGSSSMATVCAGTLAMMDGGVPLIRPVSGIAMGLVMDPETKKYIVLSDILGDEDHLGDMDFKVTGTTKGITACQMDMKIQGLESSVLTEALMQSKEGRIHILGEMLKTLDAPRADYKVHAPRIVSFNVPNDMIGAIIGPGGKIIQEIQKTTTANISIEELENGEGRVEVTSDNGTAMKEAVDWVKKIAFPPIVEVGETYEGKVKTIMAYGAFVEIIPGQDGLLHISELAWDRVEKVEDVLKEGELVKFKVTGKDPKTGKLKLSKKVLMPKPEKSES